MPPPTGGTLEVSKVANAAPYKGAGTWNGKRLDQLLTLDDAGIWDLSAFVPGDDNLLVNVRVKDGVVVEGSITRQPKRKGKFIGCLDLFVVTGRCS